MKATRYILLLLVLMAQACALAQFAFDTPAWEQFKLNTKVRIKLDFRNASADAIVQTFGEASGIAIVRDPGLTGGITLQSPRPQALKDAFAMFNVALTLRGYELSKQGNFLVIKQKQQARGSGRSGFGSGTGSTDMTGGFGAMTDMTGGRTDQSIVHVYIIKFASATAVAKIVTDVFTNQSSTTNSTNPFFGGRGGMGGPGGIPGMGGPGGQTGTTDTSQDNTASTGGFNGRGSRTQASTVKASADEYSNSIVVKASSTEHEQIALLIEQLDKQTDQPLTSKVFQLKYASASDMTSVIQNVLTNNAVKGRGGSTTTQTNSNPFFPGGFRGGGNQSSSNSNGVSADTRTNSLVVTSTKDNLALVEQVITQLDKPITFETGAFVVPLQNARADLIAQLINSSFSSSRSSGTTANTSNTRSTTTTNNNNNRTNSNNPGSLGSTSRSINNGSGTRAIAGNNYNGIEMTDLAEGAPMMLAQGQFGGGGFGGNNNSGRTSSSSSQQSTISTGYDSDGKLINYRDLTGTVNAIADTNTNSVIIITAPQNREIIQKILDQLDRIPEQVMIETLVVEASLDATNKLGVEWSAKKGSSTASSLFGLAADAAQPQGLRYTLSGTQYSVFLQGLQTDTRFDVLSTPRIFTSNNSTAQINISQSLPYVTNQTIDTNGNYAYSYAFMDVGIVLTVTPRITSNGYVTMDVTQTANDFVSYTSFNAPIVNQREAQTTVSVQDGETVVLGGIIKSSSTATINKIPLLGDIPIIGSLFRSTNKIKNKTELLVFLTPHVVRDAKEAQRLREQTESQLQKKTLEKVLKTRSESDITKTEPPTKS